jgi:uncharacterized membrane protein YdjX (TVP38/TMEM64 family)
MTPLPGLSRRRALIRLVALGVAILAVAIVAALEVPHSPGAVRDAAAAGGATGLVAATVGWAVLTPALVSGTVLALAAGLLFGPVTGTAIGIVGATCGGVMSFLLARHAGRDALHALAGNRLERLLRRLEGRGFLAVLAARLAPGVPATWLNYAAGLTRVRLTHFSAAIAIGGAPRTFAYAALGGSSGDLASPTAIAAIAVMVGLAAVAAAAAWRARRRRAR